MTKALEPPLSIKEFNRLKRIILWGKSSNSKSNFPSYRVFSLFHSSANVLDVNVRPVFRRNIYLHKRFLEFHEMSISNLIKWFIRSFRP